jgi:hypothetical protein
MKEKTAARVSAIILVVFMLILLISMLGCAVKKVEVVEYCATYYLYDSKIEMQTARGTLRNIKGFHRTKGGKYEVHTMKWDFSNMGHELYHGLVKEGMDAENHPHFK